MKTGLLMFQVILAIVGLADASYLTWKKIQGVVPGCNPAFQCETVLNSVWANIGPVPLSALGVVFYLTFLFIASTRFLGKEELQLGNRKHHFQFVSNVLGITGLGVSAILITLMALVLQAWCIFCLISAATSTLLALTTGLLYVVTRSERQHEN